MNLSKEETYTMNLLAIYRKLVRLRDQTRELIAAIHSKDDKELTFLSSEILELFREPDLELLSKLTSAASLMNTTIAKLKLFEGDLKEVSRMIPDEELGVDFISLLRNREGSTSFHHTYISLCSYNTYALADVLAKRELNLFKGIDHANLLGWVTQLGKHADSRDHNVSEIAFLGMYLLALLVPRSLPN